MDYGASKDALELIQRLTVTGKTAPAALPVGGVDRSLVCDL